MAPTTFRDRCTAALASLLDMDKPLTDEELIELGRRHLMEKELRELADLRRAALAEAEETTNRLKARLAELQAAGAVGPTALREFDLAELMQVDRMTVRSWLGKGRKPKAAATGSEAPVESSLLT